MLIQSPDHTWRGKMGSLGPPPAWQGDVLQNISNGQVARRAAARTYDAAQLSEACRHMRQLADSRREVDLFDMLANTRREETYQPYYPGVRRTTAVARGPQEGGHRQHDPCRPREPWRPALTRPVFASPPVRSGQASSVPSPPPPTTCRAWSTRRFRQPRRCASAGCSQRSVTRGPR